MEIAATDISLRNIREAIKNKRQVLQKNMELLKQENGTNAILQGMLKDYKESLDALKIKKQEQLAYFDIMQEYLDKITQDSNITEESLERARMDQHALINEMKTVQEELKNLVDESNRLV